MSSPSSGPSSRRQALWERYPSRQTALVCGALLLSAILLATGLSLPLLYTQRLFWKSTYSVWAGVLELWKEQEQGLALLIGFFSIVFPIGKLLTLVFLWFWKLPDEKRAWLLHWLGLLGKWSMLDVFVVAILIVLVKLGPLVQVEPRAGVYVFASAIVSSMLTTMYVGRLAKR